jgi:hypothetical protein
LAEASGGDAVVGAAGLRSALDSTSGWYLLSYQVARRPDGTAHALELRAHRPEVEITTNRTVTAATSEGQAEARVLRLLGGWTGRGEIPVALKVGPPAESAKRRLTAWIDATVEFGSLARVLDRGERVLRVSVALGSGKSEPIVVHRREQLARTQEGWVYTFPLEWKAVAGSQLAVTVEELASGIWGGGVVELPRHGENR